PGAKSGFQSPRRDTMIDECVLSKLLIHSLLNTGGSPLMRVRGPHGLDAAGALCQEIPGRTPAEPTSESTRSWTCSLAGARSKTGFSTSHIQQAGGGRSPPALGGARGAAGPRSARRRRTRQPDQEPVWPPGGTPDRGERGVQAQPNGRILNQYRTRRQGGQGRTPEWIPGSCGSSVQWLPAEQSQVYARCREDLGRSIRIDPALCGNANTPHPTQKGDQLVIDAGKHVHRLVLERCEIPFDRAHARRLEVEEQQAMIGCQPVPLVWAPMVGSVHGRAGREFGLHLVQDALEGPTAYGSSRPSCL